MIAVYLLPYPVRAVPAPYLWVFYKLLSVLDERALFMVGEDYLQPPAAFAAAGRWETTPLTQETYGYRLPTPDCLARHSLRALPAEVFQTLLSACRGNPLEVFRRLLRERLPALEAAVETALAGGAEGEPIEAIVTWCNCPSLAAVAAARGIPLVHLEAGPLRAPLYRPTAYFDFSGVNGNTEAERRYRALPPAPAAFDWDRLRRFFFWQGAAPGKEAPGHIGLAMQVEDDSNLVAFGNGYDNQAAAVHVRLRYGGKAPILIRTHPGSLFRARGDWFESDASYDSLAFIRRCRRVVTINSSLGLEALLLGTPVEVLGDCSYRFILDAEEGGEQSARLAFYLFAYLAPESLLFDLDYLRFRLARPAEASLVAYHLNAWLGGGEWTAGAAASTVWEVIASALART